MKVTENPLAVKSFDFALKIVDLYDIIIEKRHFSLGDQILRSGTSIGANIREGLYGQSKADFISKLNVALKEAGETEYWLDLFFHAHIISQDDYDNVIMDCQELIRLLISILKTSRSNLNS